MMVIREDIATLLRQGVPHLHVARQLGVTRRTVQRHREALGLPAPRPGHPDVYASLEDAFRQHTEPCEDGHVRWTGYRNNRGTPLVCYRRQTQSAPKVAFVLHHGRAPVGNAKPACGMGGCIAGEHLADRPMRETNRRADRAYTTIFGGVQ